MKPIRLSDLKSKKNTYFKRLGEINSSAGRYTVRYIVRRSLEALPKADKKYIGDLKTTERVLTNMIMVTEEPMDVYKAAKNYSYQIQYHKGIPRLRAMFKRFKDEYHELYNKYNSLMYRKGYSGVNYYLENAKLEFERSTATATLALPANIQASTDYNTLELMEDLSGDEEFFAELY